MRVPLSSDLVRLSPADIPRGAAVLARAFHEYPTFRRLLPDAAMRAKRLEGVMRFFLGCGRLRGEVLAPSSELEGVAVWFRASDLGFGLRDLIRAGRCDEARAPAAQSSADPLADWSRSDRDALRTFLRMAGSVR